MNADSTRLNPYVGPRAFQTGETLYGRDREQRDLLNYLLSQRVVLLYSPSGAGKTSLIHAGLIPGLQAKNFSILPVIRLNLEPPDGAERVSPTFNRYSYSALLSLEEGLPEKNQTGTQDLVNLSLGEYLDRRPPQESQNGSEQPDIEVLIFDQFEEILTVDPTDSSGRAGFFDQLGEALRQRSRWVLLSMREDYIAALDPYQRAIPTHFNNRYRLDLLGVDAARLAIQKPASQMGVDFSDQAAQKLVDDLRRVQVQRPDGEMEEQLGGYVEPVQLQVVCYRLWGSLNPGQEQISEEDLARTGDVDQSLSDYYADQVAAIAAETGVRQRAIRGWFENQLITEGGIRGQVLMGSENSGGLDNRVIRRLENAHLVRAEKRRGATWFELAHDRLIAPVRRDNAAWFDAKLSPLQRQAELWEKENRPNHLLLRDLALLDAQGWAKDHLDDLTPVEIDFMKESEEANDLELEAKKAQQRQYEMAQQLAEAEKKRAEEQARSARRLRWLVLGLGVVLVAAVVLAFLANSAQRSASRSAKDAANQAATATFALGLSEIQAATATHALGQSQIQAATAEAASTEAIIQANNAKIAQAQAEEQAQIAFARQLSAQASELLDNSTARLSDAVLLAVESLRRYPENVSRQTLVKAIQNLPNQFAKMALNDVVISVSFSSDGNFIASGSSDGTARIWDANSGQELAHKKHDDQVDMIAFSPDGESVVSVSYDLLLVWDVSSGRELGHMIHDSGITSVDISPDSKVVVYGSYDGTIRIWEVTSGQHPNFMVHNGPINTVAFSPDGQRVVAGSDDGTARVWNTSNGDELARMTHDHGVTTVDFSPDGQRVVSGSYDGTVRVWDASSGQEFVRMLHELAISAVDFSPVDGEMVVSGSYDGTVRVWDAYSGREISRQVHDSPVKLVSISPDGQSVVSVGEDGQVLVWNTSSGQRVAYLAQVYGVSEAAFSPDGERIVSGGVDGTVRVWSTYGGQEVARLVHDGPVTTLSISPDGQNVVSGSRDETARVWDSATGEELARVVHIGDVYDVNFSPDGQRVVSGSLDGTVYVWDADSGEKYARMEHEDWVSEVGLRYENRNWYSAVAFSSDGQRVISGSIDGTARVWDAASGQEISRMTHDDWVTQVAFSPDAQRVSSGSVDGTIIVWETVGGRELTRLVHDGPISAVVFSPDGRYVVSGGYDYTARVWDTVREQELTRVTHVERVNTVAFSPNGQWVVSGSLDGTARVWDAVTGQEISRMVHNGNVNAVAFSPDGNFVVSGSDDGMACVWDAANGWELACLVHDGPVNTVAFSSDGQFVASGSDDGTARVWPWTTEGLITLACSRLEHNLDEATWQQYLGSEPYRKTCPELP